MRKVISRSWHKFFFSEFDPSAVCLFRIVLGLYLLVMMIALFPNWETYLGPGGVRIEPAGQGGWSLMVATERWIPVIAWWWLGLFATLAFTLGFRTRWMTGALFILQTSVNHTDPMIVNGEDMVLRILLFYGFFAPLGARYSIDSLLGNSVKAPLWPVRLMQLNIAGIYAFSLPIKLASDPSWLNGEAIYWVMMTSTWNRWPLHRLFYQPIVSQLLTYAAVATEGLFPILVWFKRTRLPILAAIAFFHLGLAILLKNVSFFSFLMTCSFLVFVPGESVRLFFAVISVVWKKLCIKIAKPEEVSDETLSPACHGDFSRDRGGAVRVASDAIPRVRVRGLPGRFRRRR